MQDYELDAWLGDVELTDEQRDTLRDEVEWVEQEYPNPDERTEAISAAVQYLLGVTTPVEAGRRLAAARTQMFGALAAAKVMARLAVAAGATEVDTAQTLGLDRMTIRRVLGKR
ncbi:hypothetical protein [Nakamurella aerolata]|uniref:Uncharacterized protein n=1 Tax=Nakamurella aerolata TaxID=1656892 RepID=A0A849A8S2_9ACTN|nr:hypothetical protein [Nakamurella aerolata]NNG36959.1 hypothetical protein [Nakamurella aerolata]